MKSLTKPALRAIPAARVQLSLHVQGVLRGLRQAFNGLRVSAGKSQLHTVARASIHRGHKREVPLPATNGAKRSSFASMSLRPALPSTCGRQPAGWCRNRARLAPQLRWQQARQARSGGQCVQPAYTR
jgi:hypothetical protein